MKNRSGTYGKTWETLPLEEGGKRVEVTDIAKRLRKDLPLTLTLSPKGRGETFLTIGGGPNDFSHGQRQEI